MKPYMDLKGKGWWSYFWGDKTAKKMKRIYKKSARRFKIDKDIDYPPDSFRQMGE